MNNADFNYKYQYEQWHDDTPSSRQNDINCDIGFINMHNITPPSTIKQPKILDLGCGMGRFLLALKSMGYTDLSGVDIDAHQVSVAQKDGINAVLSDGVEYLKSNHAIFDTIYCLDVLEHIAKAEHLAFLRLLHSHLSEQGMLAIRVPNALAPTASYFRYIDFTHEISHTDCSLTFLLKNAGFEHFCFRPEYKESRKLRLLKRPFANLYFHQFGIQDPILTPNILAVVFKDVSIYEAYMTNTPKLENKYESKYDVFRQKWKEFFKKFGL